MKKPFLITFLSFLGIFASQAQITYSVEAGLNLSRLYNNMAYRNPNLQSGFKTGINASLPANKYLHFTSGLFISTKGRKIKVDSAQSRYKSNLIIGYIEIPINLLLQIPISDKGAFVLNGGPYLAYGIGGVISNNMNGDKSSTPLSFGVSYEEMKRLDYGFNAGFGYRSLKDIFVKAQYEWGIADLSNAKLNKEKNRSFQVSIAFPLVGNH